MVFRDWRRGSAGATLSSNLREEDRPVRTFLVDPATGGAEPHEDINSLIERAGRIVGK